MVQEPLTERGRRSRERIVDAAAAAVAERGAGGCSLDQILEAAGASKSQLYHYFSDKGDLVRAVIARRLGETVDCQGPLLGGARQLRRHPALVRWMIDENETQAARLPARHARQRARRPRRSRRADLAGGFDTWMGYVIDGLARMQARGDLAADADPHRLGPPCSPASRAAYCCRRPTRTRSTSATPSTPLTPTSAPSASRPS